MATETEQQIIERADRAQIARVLEVFGRKGWHTKIITPFGEFGDLPQVEEKRPRKKINNFSAYGYQEKLADLKTGDAITFNILPEHNEEAAQNLAAAIAAKAGSLFGRGVVKTKYHPKERILEVRRPIDLDS